MPRLTRTTWWKTWLPRIVPSASLVIAGGLLVGCDAATSATDLVSGGPPQIRQVFMTEVFTDNSGISRQRAGVLAFGTHPDADPTLVHPVTTASAANTQSIRVVISQLLEGNHLEEVACRGPLADGTAYSFVPDGTTPDDIANCAVSTDLLPTRCPAGGLHSVCIGANGPVGVLDEDQDGAADDTRFIQGAAGIQCGSIKVPMDLDLSYWQPSGDQLVPAHGGILALGPAVVLRPLAGLPTNAQCHVVFASSVTNKGGDEVCAPPAGDVTMNCPAVGDTTLAKFGTEPLTLTGSNPLTGAMGQLVHANGQTYGEVITDWNVPVKLASFAGVTISPATPSGAAVVPVADPVSTSVVHLQFPGGYTAGTTYTVTIPVTVEDDFGSPLPAPVTITFTTAS